MTNPVFGCRIFVILSLHSTKMKSSPNSTVLAFITCQRQTNKNDLLVGYYELPKIYKNKRIKRWEETLSLFISLSGLKLVEQCSNSPVFLYQAIHFYFIFLVRVHRVHFCDQASRGNGTAEGLEYQSQGHPKSWEIACFKSERQRTVDKCYSQQI